MPKTVKTINNHQIIVKNCDKHANNHQTIVIIGDNVHQKSVDMGLRPRKNMYGWVGFFSFGPHTPVTFLDKYPPGHSVWVGWVSEGVRKVHFPGSYVRKVKDAF